MFMNGIMYTYLKFHKMVEWKFTVSNLNCYKFQIDTKKVQVYSLYNNLILGIRT
jgi:hypothetical protein